MLKFQWMHHVVLIIYFFIKIRHKTTIMKYVLSISMVLCYMFRLLEAIIRQIRN
jgi:hypothetical protein